MHDANEWRLALAQQIGRAYAVNPKVEVIILAGSTVRGMADRHSDIELDVFWKEPPTDEDRQAAIERAGGDIIIYWDYTDDEWGEVYAVNGFKLDMSGFLSETVDRYLSELIEHSHVTELNQLLIAAVQHGVLIGDRGATRLAAWQAKAASFPDELACALIQSYLQVEGPWTARHALAERGDWLILNGQFCQIERKLVGMLLGLNRIYLPHPDFKWAEALIAAMRYAPANFAARLRQVFRPELLDGIQQLESLIDETFDLLETHLPQLDLTEKRHDFLKRRPVWEEVPAGLLEVT
jgi:hypothetical protein